MGCSQSSDQTHYIQEQTDALLSFLKQAASQDIEHTDAAFQSLTSKIDPILLSTLDAQDNPVPYLRTLFKAWSLELKNTRKDKDTRAKMKECVILAGQLQQQVQKNYESMLVLTDKANKLMDRVEKHLE